MTVEVDSFIQLPGGPVRVSQPISSPNIVSQSVEYIIISQSV